MNRIRRNFGHRARERELQDELAAHIRLDAEDRVSSGSSVEEAHKAARREFGSVLSVSENTRDVWGWTNLEQTAQDVRYAARNLVSRPAFATMTIATLALSIGATTAIFSIVNAVLLRPLPFQDPDRLVSLQSVNRTRDNGRATVAPADFKDWREQTRSLQDVAAYSDSDLISLWTGDRPETITTARVTWNYFRTLGVPPMLGTTFSEPDETGPTSLVTNIVLSHRLWQSRFGGDASVVGKRIRTAEGGVAIVSGVMPTDFRFPSYADIWVPMGCCREMEFRGTRYWRVVGRLQRGQSLEAAQDEFTAIAARLARTYPKENQDWSVTVVPLSRAIVGDVGRPLWILMAGVAFVIAIACANVGGLALARSSSRRREMVVKAALGASRPRLIRQLLAEGLLIALAGTAGGILVASAGVTAFFALLAETQWSRLTWFQDGVQLDGTVLSFAALLSVLTTLALTVAPVTDSLRLALSEAVRAEQRATQTRREHRVYKILVASQFACTIVLLAGAALLMQSFIRMLEVKPGYDAAGVVVTGLPLPAQQQRTAFIDEALARIQSTAGIDSAAIMGAPRPGQLAFPINLQERPLPSDVTVRYSSVSLDYFRVLRARLIRGRTFERTDGADTTRVVLINQTLANQFFPGDNPIGRRLVLAYGNQRTPLEVIGIMADLRQDAPAAPVQPEVFVHWPQFPWLAATLVVRGTHDPSGVPRAVRDAITSLDRNLPSYPSFALADVLNSQVATPRLYTVVLGAFAIVAAGLAALGIYGLFAHMMGRRTNEFAVRMAVGGQRSAILTMVLRDGLRLSLAGIACGLVGTIWLTRLIESLLFEIGPRDPLTLAGVTALLATVAIAACYLPARRAANTSPIAALRHE